MPKILEFFGLSNVFTSVKTYWRPAIIVLIAIGVVAMAYILTKNYTVHCFALIIGIVLILLANMRLGKEIRDNFDSEDRDGGK